MFLKVKKEIASDSGILYVLILDIDGETVYKIGVTKRQIFDRVSEIVLSFYHKYRYFPYCKPKRFKTVENVYEKEANMHRALKEYKYTPINQFSGSTECFSGLDLDVVLEVYERVLNNNIEGKVTDGRIEDTTERD